MPMHTRRVVQVVGAVALVSVLFVALAYVLYSGLTEHVLGANDFFSRWMGARALFLRGENPYSDSVTREIQLAMYGRLAQPGEDQVAFAYPLYAVFVAAPLVGLPYAQAQALWMALLIVLVVASVLILMRLNHLAVSPLLLAGVMLSVLVSYPVVRAIFLGQYAIVAFFLLVLALLVIARQHDFLGGIFLVLATVKPQPLAFFVPTILFWAIEQRRWKIVGGATIASGVLIGGAMLWVPMWLADFVWALKNYADYVPVGPPIQTFSELFLPPEWSRVFMLVCGAGLTGWIGLSVWRARHATWERFRPILGLVAIVTVLMAGRVGTSDQVLLLIPWLGWFGEWSRRGQFVAFLMGMGGFVILPWICFLATLRGNAEHVGVTLVLPFLSLVVWLWQSWRGYADDVNSASER